MQAGLRPTIPETVPAPLAKLITDCWQSDPWQRPVFSTILRTLRGLSGCRTTRRMTTLIQAVHWPTGVSADDDEEDAIVVEGTLMKQLGTKFRSAQLVCTSFASPDLGRKPQSMLFVEEPASVWVGCREGHLIIFNAEVRHRPLVSLKPGLRRPLRQNGRQLAQTRAHQADITGLVLAASGIVASIAADGLLKLWKAELNVPDVAKTPTVGRASAGSSALRSSMSSEPPQPVEASTSGGAMSLMLGGYASRTAQGPRAPEKEGKLQMKVSGLLGSGWKTRLVAMNTRKPGQLLIMKPDKPGSPVLELPIARLLLQADPANEPVDTFAIVDSADKEKARPLLFQAASPSEKAAWTAAFKMALDVLRSDSGLEMMRCLNLGDALSAVARDSDDTLLVGTLSGNIHMCTGLKSGPAALTVRFPNFSIAGSVRSCSHVCTRLLGCSGSRRTRR